MNQDRRAELKQQYKESPPPMGIFQIRNTANGKVFVGTSKNLPGILNRHRFDLRMKSHKDRPLQADWDRDGEEAFVFEVLEELEPPEVPSYDPKDDLAALKELWLEKLEPYGEKGYNKAP